MKGDEIPISAQLVSLADVYDALINERWYKDAFSKEQALMYIREENAQPDRMSHDMRTPMNAIVGMTGIAGQHLNEPADKCSKVYPCWRDSKS